MERAHGNRNRGYLLPVGEYWEFLIYFTFFLTYQRFWEVDFFKFCYQEKATIVEKGFLKFSV